MAAIVVASANGDVGIGAAAEILRRGGSALDAAEAGVRLVEDNLGDTSVGTGGLPNLLGVVELDASIMDGRTLASGAVAALKGYPNPVSIARHVMTDLPHVLLVGEGAARFAAECGFHSAGLLTDASRETWRSRIDPSLEERLRAGTMAHAGVMDLIARLANDPENVGGTENFLARDQAGNIASAVSTSGWAWKYPGRTGDSPVIGAGNYCDDRYGAAACTGQGERAIRLSVARSVILYLKQGLPVQEAVAEAMRDTLVLENASEGAFHIVAMDAQGNHAAVSNREKTYIYQTDEMETHAELPRQRLR